MSSYLRSLDPGSGQSAEDAYQPPITETERVIAGMWREILELPRVGVLNNFFDLGGHSVLLHMVQDHLARELGRDIPVVELFRYPTVRALARHLDGAAEHGSHPRDRERSTGLSRLRAQRGRREREG